MEILQAQWDHAWNLNKTWWVERLTWICLDLNFILYKISIFIIYLLCIESEILPMWKLNASRILMLNWIIKHLIPQMILFDSISTEWILNKSFVIRLFLGILLSCLTHARAALYSYQVFLGTRAFWGSKHSKDPFILWIKSAFWSSVTISILL